MSSPTYTPGKLTRRQTLQWMGAMSAAVTLPMAFGSQARADDTAASGFAPWPQLELTPIDAPGYGQDPDLIAPAPAPWPRILTEAQLALLAVLSDIIVPRDGDVPAASEVGVPDVLDEWVSAPYPRQRAHRDLIVPGLSWMDDEAQRRHASGTFVRLSDTQQLQIVDDIAFKEQTTPPGLEKPKAFFAGLRTLVVGAFFTSPQGIDDLGYIGNVPIAGDYPGPTPEAMAHLEGLIEELGL